MKISKLFNLALIASCALLFTNCDKQDDSEGTNITPLVKRGDIGNGSISEAAPFEITKDTVFPKGIYNLKGYVYVTRGATVTFQPGTIIKGDKKSMASLIIEPGAKIIARGTASEPIVFTSAQPKGSRRPGDWGGLVICGSAKNNNGNSLTIEGGLRTRHGGNDDNDNSGVLSYVRIEFAGFPYETNKEINGLTLGSVGRGTTIDHIQVSYTNDDSFEWFGGTVNAKYLVAYHGWDDEFDTDNGYSGKLQFLLGVRHPKIGDQSLSNGFESDNNSQGTNTTPKTAPIFSNVTLVGPIGQHSGFANTLQFIDGASLSPNNGSQLGQFQAAMHIRRYSRLNCFNSVAMGYPVGLILDNANGNTQGMATMDSLRLKNIVFAQMGVIGSDVNKTWTDKFNNGQSSSDAQSFSHTFFSAQTGNQALANISDLKLRQPNSLSANPNWGPSTGSPLTGKSNLFTDAMLQSGFESVDYIGAFRSDSEADNWTRGWTNFDPQNTDY